MLEHIREMVCAKSTCVKSDPCSFYRRHHCCYCGGNWKIKRCEHRKQKMKVKLRILAGAGPKKASGFSHGGPCPRSRVTHKTNELLRKAICAGIKTTLDRKDKLEIHQKLHELYWLCVRWHRGEQKRRSGEGRAGSRGEVVGEEK